MLKTLKTSSLIHLHLLQLCYLRINCRLVDWKSHAAAAAKYVSATKKGCHNVFTKTVGIIEDEKLGGNKTGICSECSKCCAEHSEQSIETEVSAGMYILFFYNQ